MFVDAQSTLMVSLEVELNCSAHHFEKTFFHTNIMALRRTVQWLVAAASVTQISASPHGLVPRQDSLPIGGCPGYKATNVQQTSQGLTVSNIASYPRVTHLTDLTPRPNSA